jgi:3-oxoadipate enol-lactonase
MQVLADDGARIDVRVDGRRRENAVVLIHGFPMTREIWEAQSEALARDAYVLLPDLRGAGFSQSPDGPYLMERLAADVAIVLDAAGVERAALVGHSMGGYVALAFARMFTERVTKLALVAGRLRADTDAEADARRKLADRVEREVSAEAAIDAYIPRLFSDATLERHPEIVRRAYAIARANAPAGIAETLRGLALRVSSEDIAGDLELPVLVLAGEMDRVVAMDESRSVAAQFPRSQLALCRSSGHLPMLEEPECVSEALVRWLAEAV